MNSPWYAMTTREINPMHTQNGYARQALAIATARLSHQALTWSDRTRYATPSTAPSRWILTIPSTAGPRPRTTPSSSRSSPKRATDSGAALGGKLPGGATAGIRTTDHSQPTAARSGRVSVSRSSLV
ncbi:RNaseH domain-containing protein [Streptomyces sp. NPDC047917]|uniref:RNaseH domain-containing protein n=1 Tax=Streptomyces sp. NPDC047917 TaxID=3365491 RepID=UPI00371DE436